MPSTRRITRPGTWPMSWWYFAAILWVAAVTGAFYGINAIWHGWDWPWATATFAVVSACQVIALHRRRRRRNG